MKITQTVVQEVLNQEDIEGLRQLGAPEDEYMHEAQEIVSQLGQREVSEEDLATVVQKVWARSFGPFTAEDVEKRSPVFRQVAHQILSHP